MKNILATFLIIIISFNSYAAKVDINNFIFEDFYKQSVTLDDYNFDFRNGLIVNVWASWCTPCVKELPSLMKLQQIMPQVTVIGVNVDSSIKKAKNFYKKTRLPTEVIVNLHDEDAKQLKKLNISSLPVTLIINRQGKIVKRVDGYRNWANEVNIMEIKRHLRFF